MKNIAKKHLHIRPRFDVRFRAIAARWTARTDLLREERFLVAAVHESKQRRGHPVKDPYALRAAFFKLALNEKSALHFLDSVGVWSATDGDTERGSDGRLRSGRATVGLNESQIVGAYGHRWFNARASIESVGSLQQSQQHWRELMQPSKLRRAFDKPPAADAPPHRKDLFAFERSYMNTLPVHLEWEGKRATAVIQPCTFEELLIALAWVDAITDAPLKKCRYCRNPYTFGKTFYCDEQCSRNARQKQWRDGLPQNNQEKSASSQNGKHSHPATKKGLR
jgi:hypothetical protein